MSEDLLFAAQLGLAGHIAQLIESGVDPNWRRPDGTTTQVEGQRIPVRLSTPEATATNVEVFLNVEFTIAGTHWVEVLMDGDLKIRYPLRVGTPSPSHGLPPIEPA